MALFRESFTKQFDHAGFVFDDEQFHTECEKAVGGADPRALRYRKLPEEQMKNGDSGLQVRFSAFAEYQVSDSDVRLGVQSPLGGAGKPVERGLECPAITIRGEEAVRDLVCILIVTSLAALPKSEQPKLSPPEQEVLDARNARTDASNNRNQEVWSRSVAEECIFNTDAGERLTKAEFRAWCRNFRTITTTRSIRVMRSCTFMETRGIESALHDA